MGRQAGGRRLWCWHLVVMPEYAEIGRGALPHVLLPAILSLLNYLQLLESSSFPGCLGKVRDSHAVSRIRTFRVDFHLSSHIEKWLLLNSYKGTEELRVH